MAAQQVWRILPAMSLAISLLMAYAGEAYAHGAPLDRRVGWSDWNSDPVIWLNLILLGWLYLRGWSALRERIPFARPSMTREPVAFALGLAVLAVALLSPLDLLSDQLAWAHMVQHMLLMTVAAPLMVMGAPLFVCLWGLPFRHRRFYGRLRHAGQRWHLSGKLLWNPILLWALYALAMWTWHVPALYQAALRSAAIHDLQHLTFFASAYLYWRVLLDPRSRLRLNWGLGVLYLFTTTLHATALGVFMTIAPHPWYADYIGRTELWSLTALEDQQLAGLIMWMPACAAYAIAAIVLFARAIQQHSAEPTPALLQTME